MSTPNTKTCDVTGQRLPLTAFYTNQSHCRAVDNLRRNTGATKAQIRQMFNQIANY